MDPRILSGTTTHSWQRIRLQQPPTVSVILYHSFQRVLRGATIQGARTFVVFVENPKFMISSPCTLHLRKEGGSCPTQPSLDKTSLTAEPDTA